MILVLLTQILWLGVMAILATDQTIKGANVNENGNDASRYRVGLVFLLNCVLPRTTWCDIAKRYYKGKSPMTDNFVHKGLYLVENKLNCDNEANQYMTVSRKS